MSIVTYTRSGSIRNIGSKLLSREGYTDTTKSRILSQFTNALAESLEGDYDSIYSIAENVDIGTASGKYLDRFGRLIGEPRERTTVAKDLTLNNVSIVLVPQVPAKYITDGELPLIIPKNTEIGTNGMWYIRTIDTVAMGKDSSEVYVRVAAISSTISRITTDMITDVNIDLSSLAGVNQASAGSYKLKAVLRSPIETSLSTPTDNEYRYVLQQKSNSIGLFNQNTINALLDIDGLSNVSVRKYYGGVDVYVEPTTLSISDQVLEIARSIIEQEHQGSSVNVLLPRFRNTKILVQLVLTNPDQTLTDANKVPALLSDAINAIPMGKVIGFDSIISTNIMPYLSSNVVACNVIKVSYDGRTVIDTNNIIQNFNEKATTLAENIQVV